MAGQDLITRTVTEFARTLARAAAISEVLNDLTEQVTVALDVAGAGVSVLEGGELRFAAATDARSAGLERAQEAGQAGPCMDACQAGTTVAIADLPGTSRPWGRYQQAARDAGVVAIASVPMRHDGESVGSLDLYSTVRRVWSARDLGMAEILADMATGYLIQARELDRQFRINEQLRGALDSRIVIEQAKGVLAAERHISVDEAFEILRQHARSHSISLRSVAEAVVGLRLRP